MTNRNHKMISDAEEELIQKMIESNPDAPDVTGEHLAEAGPFAEAFPDPARNMQKNVGGRPRAANPKIPVSIRLDQDVVAKFKATGPGWQTRINEVLRREVLTDR